MEEITLLEQMEMMMEEDSIETASEMPQTGAEVASMKRTAMTGEVAPSEEDSFKQAITVVSDKMSTGAALVVGPVGVLEPATVALAVSADGNKTSIDDMPTTGEEEMSLEGEEEEETEEETEEVSSSGEEDEETEENDEEEAG